MNEERAGRERGVLQSRCIKVFSFIKNISMKFFWIVLLVVCDQVTKYLFFDLQLLESTRLMTPLINTGIAWSLPLPQWIVIALSIVLIVFILWFLVWDKYRSYDLAAKYYTPMKWWLILFVSWAIGNLLDRLIYSWVRDFVDFHVRPVFNLADTFLTIAFLIIVWVEFVWPFVNKEK